MNRKQKITVSVIGLFIVLLALMGITFGYFLTNIKGNANDKSIDILSAYLELTYEDGNGTIKKENIEPGAVIEEKTFTVTNTGSLTIDNYGVYLEEVINTFKNKDDVTYTLTCKSSRSGKTCNGVDETTYPSLNELLVTNSIDKNEVHTYTLKVVFKETGKDQSVDMNKKIEGRVQIYDQKDVVYLTGEVTGYKEGDYVLVESNPKKSQIVDGKYKVVGLKPATHSIKVVGSDNVVKGTKNFEVIKGSAQEIIGDTAFVTEDSKSITINLALANNDLKVEMTDIYDSSFKDVTLAETIYISAVNATEETGRTILNENSTNIFIGKSGDNERTLNKAEDDYGDSYYYRGNVTDNYVSFAGFIWRIVRINGNGSIRIILDGLLSKVTYDGSPLPAPFNNNSEFNKLGDSNKYVGYMYGNGTDNYDAEHQFVGNKLLYTPGVETAGHSTIKVHLDKFYDIYIENKVDNNNNKFSEYISDTEFCGDKTIAQKKIGVNNTSLGYGRNQTYYSAVERLKYEYSTTNLETAYPTLKCAENQKEDYSRYSVNVETLKNGKNTNGDLTYPIALMSADELTMAGAWRTTSTNQEASINTTYYLYNLDTVGKWEWWTMTPDYKYSNSDGTTVFSARTIGYISGSSGGSLSSGNVNFSIGVRPVINLKANIKWKSGDGTKNNPYEVKLD